jgi:hypothetical protein
MKQPIIITDKVYLEIADALAYAVCNRDYYSGKVAVVVGDVEFTLEGSFVMYYEKSRDEEFLGCRILSDIIPVWWDFTACEGSEYYNTDFSFDELKNYMVC